MTRGKRPASQAACAPAALDVFPQSNALDSTSAISISREGPTRQGPSQRGRTAGIGTWSPLLNIISIPRTKAWATTQPLSCRPPWLPSCWMPGRPRSPWHTPRRKYVARAERRTESLLTRERALRRACVPSSSESRQARWQRRPAAAPPAVLGARAATGGLRTLAAAEGSAALGSGG